MIIDRNGQQLWFASEEKLEDYSILLRTGKLRYTERASTLEVEAPSAVCRVFRCACCRTCSEGLSKHPWTMKEKIQGQTLMRENAVPEDRAHHTQATMGGGGRGGGVSDKSEKHRRRGCRRQKTRDWPMCRRPTHCPAQRTSVVSRPSARGVV